ncbi:hypothetical protein SAMN05421823_104485 [Catalinimonas alkaloidigena]|uniref:SPW repeat-containing integral membrane domain-containing protein n=1 Tax=Catalinimonas alkaloidigena TaxID=1075417 RepID=A0A1G9HN55_9BACT|nr:hypothetical protein [Catalinimonas alkaloidigena]SDL14360.1 hypothetical protein SAMN05421823_104485 [Catalinimonas alkaloidigena]
MRFIPTTWHGVLDYMTGAFLIAAPWIFDFARGSYETWIPVVLGIGAIGYSIFTRYELGLVQALPMRTHLWLDGISGGFLATSPWFFDFADYVYLPHVLLGIFEIGAALFTYTVSDRQRAGALSDSPVGRHQAAMRTGHA